MEDKKEGNATDQNIDLQADTLTDLPVADEQSDETKGGGGHVKVFDGQTGALLR